MPTCSTSDAQEETVSNEEHKATTLEDQEIRRVSALLCIDEQTNRIDLSKLKKRNPSLYDSIKSFQKDSEGNPSIGISDLAKAQHEFESQARTMKWFKFIIVFQLVVIILQTAANFGVAFMANEISKETGAVESGGATYLTGKSNSNAILKTQAANSKVRLLHAPALDVAHLATIDQLTYTFYSSTGIQSGSKVLGFQKSANTTITNGDGDRVVLDAPEVTFTLATGAKIVVDVWGAYLNDGDGGVFDLCGATSCSSFEVDDAGVDGNRLEEAVLDIRKKYADHSRRLHHRDSYGHYWGGTSSSGGGACGDM